MKNDPILIFGMDRSGTSVLGSMVKAWGAYGGRSLAVDEAYNEENPNENRVIINYLGGRLFTTIFHPEHQEKMRQVVASGTFAMEFKHLIDQEMGDERRFCFLKDPLLALILPFLNKCFPNATCIIPVRDPFESAVSWQKFLMPKESNHKIVYANLLRWQSIMTAAVRDSNPSRRLFISFEKIHTNPLESVCKIARFLDAAYQTATSNDTINLMAKRINNSMYRNRKSDGFLDLQHVDEDQKSLYRILLDLEHDPTMQVDMNKMRLPAGAGEHILNSIAISQLANSSSKKGFSSFGWVKNIIAK